MRAYLSEVAGRIEDCGKFCTPLPQSSLYLQDARVKRQKVNGNVEDERRHGGGDDREGVRSYSKRAEKRRMQVGEVGRRAGGKGSLASGDLA